MKKITDESCIELMKEKFPKFLPYWESFIIEFGSEVGIHTQMMPFGRYAIDTIKSNDETELKKIFNFVEFLLCYGDESVQNAIATSFLEYLMNKDPDEVKFSTFVKFLGKNAIDYCRAWDTFIGFRTEGLWDEKTVNEWKEAVKNKKRQQGMP